MEIESSSDDMSDRNLAGDWGFLGAKNISQEASHYEDTTSYCSPAIDVPEDPTNFCMKLHATRNMDAHYVVYLGDHETGDTVVWSASDCLRVFHQSECILPFLAKAKACPCHWFIGPEIKKGVACGGSGGMP
jgi:hypothetical protein